MWRAGGCSLRVMMEDISRKITLERYLNIKTLANKRLGRRRENIPGGGNM